MLSKKRVKLICMILFIAGTGAGLLTDNHAIATVHGFSSGPPDGVTGAPDESNCTQCHNMPNGSMGSFTVQAPTSYTPNTTYQITVTHENDDLSRGAWGFELTALTGENNRAGNLQSTDGTTQVIAGGLGDRQYIEHTLDGAFFAQIGGASWTFNWTAPSCYVGPITFYAAGNQANGNGNNEGDQIYLAQVNVSPKQECSYSLSSGGAFFNETGGSGGVSLSANGGCGWDVVNDNSWIIITSKESGCGGDGISFEVRENFTTAARTGTLTIAGVTYTVVQDGGLGADCNYSITPFASAFAAGGGGGTINVSGEARCAWQAVSSAGWVTLAPGSIGTGDGVVTYTVAANAGPSGRTATITVAGRTFRIKQKKP